VISLKLKTKLRKGIVRMLVSLLILYVLICVAGCALQRRLIYFPTKLDPRVAEEMAARDGFQPWRNKAGEIIGWKLAANSPPTGSVLVVHGNAGCALNRDYLARPIHQAASCDVYVLEYPGYGARPGSPSMKSFLAASEESVGQRQMPFLPVSLILRERYNPAEWLADYRGPVSILIAGVDEVIPPDLGHKLHDGYAGPKRLQVVEGARHNDVAEQSAEWWKEVFSFWHQHSRSAAGSR